jgi:uncharacterized protein (TIGR02265 family)
MANDDVWKERVVFSSLIDGYMRGLGDRFTPALAAKLKATGLDVKKMPPAMPAAELPKYMYVIVDEVWPGVPRVEQLRLLGLEAIRGWSKGLLGSAACAMLRLIGPRRTLTRLDRAFSTTNNFNKATTELIGEKEALISVNDVQEMPSYWVGIFEAGLEILGLDGTVQVDSQQVPGATFRVKWK